MKSVSPREPHADSGPASQRQSAALDRPVDECSRKRGAASSRAAPGHRRLALASLLGDEAARRPGDGNGESAACRTAAFCRPRRSAPSTSTWSARRRRWRPSTTSRRWQDVVRQGPARFHPQGPAPHHHDQRPDRFPIAPSDLQVRAARQDRRMGLANCCPTRRTWWTTSPSSAPCTPRPSTTSRPSRSSRPAS